VHCKAFYPQDKILDIWNLYQEELLNVSILYNAKVHLFLLMSNHYHLLISTPDKNLPEIMRSFQSSVCIGVEKLLNNWKHKFAVRYKWKLIGDSRQFAQTYKYIVQNPLEAKMVKNIEDYSLSTFSFQNGNFEKKLNLKIPIHESTNHDFYAELPEDLDERRDLLNGI